MLRKVTINLALSLCFTFIVITQLYGSEKRLDLSVEDKKPSRSPGSSRVRRAQVQQAITQPVIFDAIQNSTLGVCNIMNSTSMNFLKFSPPDLTKCILQFQKILVLGLPDRLDKKDVWSLANIASDLKIEWVDGIRGRDISPQARPAGWSPLPDTNERSRTASNTVGSLRGHLNAVRR